MNIDFTPQDEAFMQRALALARQGEALGEGLSLLMSGAAERGQDCADGPFEAGLAKDFTNASEPSENLADLAVGVCRDQRVEGCVLVHVAASIAGRRASETPSVRPGPEGGR